MGTHKLLVPTLTSLYALLTSIPVAAQNQILTPKDTLFLQKTKIILDASSVSHLKEILNKESSDYISLAQWWCSSIESALSEKPERSSLKTVLKDEEIILLNASYLAGTEVYCPQHKGAVDSYFAIHGFTVNAQPQEIKSAKDIQRISTQTTLHEDESPEKQALTKIIPGSKIYIENSEFGIAISAAIQKNNIPVVLVTSRNRADFYLKTVTQANKEHVAERVIKLYLFWPFAGNGKSFDANVLITNTAGDVIFADAVKKDNPRKAANKIVDRLKTHIENSLPQ
jgi:hypothetical protein